MTGFRFITAHSRSMDAAQEVPRPRKVPLSAYILGVLVLCCLFAELLMTKDPTYLDLSHCTVAPNREFLFGTDSLGRDIFSGIWYGGRISLCIGITAALLSACIGFLYGTISALAPAWLDRLLMRLAELYISVPSLLLVLFFQAILGKANVFSLSIVIGLTNWCHIAKVVRTQVRQLRRNEYIVASKCMGAGFFHILRRHLLPNLLASTSFMVVTNVRTAITIESTLSFLGMGLPLEVISWGSMLSLAESALTSASWWILLIPGAFLLTLFFCLTHLADKLRQSQFHKTSNL